MQTLVGDLDSTKGHAQGYHGPQELVVIAGYVHHPCAAFGMPQHPPYDIGVALAPAQAILLCFPAIQDIAHEIQSVTGVMFEEVVEFFGLAVTRAEMHIADCYRPIMFFLIVIIIDVVRDTDHIQLL